MANQVENLKFKNTIFEITDKKARNDIETLNSSFENINETVNTQVDAVIKNKFSNKKTVVTSLNLLDTTMFEGMTIADLITNYNSGDIIISVSKEAFVVGQSYNTEIMFTDETSYAAGDFYFQFLNGSTVVFSRYTFNLTNTVDSAKLIFNKTHMLNNYGDKTIKYIQVCQKKSGENYPAYSQYSEDVIFDEFATKNDLEKLSLPQLSTFFYPKRIKMIGHRGGGSKTYTENSTGAFKEGCKAGYDFIETDVWQTSDRELVCIHDQTLDRTTNGTGDVMTMTLSEIQSITLKDGSTIPTLRDFLLICKKYGKVGVIEVKNINQDWERLNEELTSVGMNDSVIILCTSIDYLSDIRNILTKAHCSYLMYATESVTETLLAKLQNITNASISTNYNFTKSDVELCHKHRVLIGKWTIDSEESANELIELGVDFITTNNPGLII